MHASHMTPHPLDLHLIRASCPRIMSTEIRAKRFPFYFWSNRPRRVGRSQGQHLLVCGKQQASRRASSGPDTEGMERSGHPGLMLPLGVQVPHI